MLSLILTIIVIGVILGAINVYIPMDAKIKNILNVVVVIAVVIYCLSAFGLFHRIDAVGVPQIR